jgi:hypothetical protein
MRTGALAKSEKHKRLHANASRLEHAPLCAACQFGKQRQRSAPGMKHVTDKEVLGALKKGHLYPGQCVSADHFICSTRGRLFTSKGKSKANDMYTGGCLFVDHCSTYVDCRFQTHLNTHQTLISKEEYELMCRDVGVIPQEYLTDNGSAFSSKDYTAKLREFSQIYRFAGVGAHHHNGIAERAIQTIMSVARTMMLHAAIHWPETADPALWPMAVQHAIFLWNHMPDPTTGMSPTDVFTKTRWEQRKFLDLHVWGCPVYVLEKAIADGKKLPHWQPRSHRTMHMGLSPLHASTVPTVLNLDTGAITPQFQVMFDDWFSTVTSTIADMPNFTEDVWQKMFGESEWQYFGENDNDDNSPDEQAVMMEQHVRVESRQNEIMNRMDAVEQVVSHNTQSNPSNELPSASTTPFVSPSGPRTATKFTPAESRTNQDSPPATAFETLATDPWERKDFETNFESRSTQSPVSVMNPIVTPASQLTPTDQPIQKSVTFPPPIIKQESKQVQQREIVPPASQPQFASDTYIRRSTRNRKEPARLIMDPSQKTYCAKTEDTNATPWICLIAEHLAGMGINNPEIYKASISDPDTLSYEQVLRSPDLEKWKEAALKEITELSTKETWVEESIDKATSKILPGTWVFKLKRAPDGTAKKYKARYCVRGDLQEGTFDTFSPVISWSTIRIILVLSIALGWQLVCVDFSNAFVQAILDEPIWIHLPCGFKSTMTGKTCLRLRKSLHGIAAAPRL